jgi:hypothetical protein
MEIKMSQIPIRRVLMDTCTPNHGTYDFTIDCGAVCFDASYDGDGKLSTIDQYFFTEQYSRDDLEASDSLVNVDDSDFPAKTYLLTRELKGNEWLRFHAVVQQKINPDYFFDKYVTE